MVVTTARSTPVKPRSRSPLIAMPMGCPTALTSPKSRPDLAGSMSIALTISMPDRPSKYGVSIRPSGPSPTCAMRIGDDMEDDLNGEWDLK